jgi:hypothetical protein
MAGEGLVRLAGGRIEGEPADLEGPLARLKELEDEYRRRIAAQLEAGEGSVPPAEFFRWGAELAGALPEVRSLEHWDALESQRILPRLYQPIQVLDRHLTGPLAASWHEWKSRYLPAVTAVLGELRRRAASRSRAVERRIAEAVDPLLPPERRGESLSRKALWTVASTPGVSCVLVGMRQEAYVEDALAVLPWPPLAEPNAVYAAAHGLHLDD